MPLLCGPVMPFCLRVSLLFIILATAVFTPRPGFCAGDQGSESITLNYLVAFDPPVVINRGEGFVHCSGVILSPDRVALPSACAAPAKRLRQKRFVRVKDHLGNTIGQLPAIRDQPFAALQSLLEPDWLMPFNSDLEPGDNFIIFADTRNLTPNKLSAPTYHLLNPFSPQEDLVEQTVQLQKLPGGSAINTMFRLPGLSAAQLKQYPAGSPVVNEQREVLCC